MTSHAELLDRCFQMQRGENLLFYNQNSHGSSKKHLLFAAENAEGLISIPDESPASTRAMDSKASFQFARSAGPQFFVRERLKADRPLTATSSRARDHAPR